MFKFLKRTVATLLIIYLALFGLTKAIRYPEPIAAIKLGLAPASKTPDLMPSHIIEPADTRIAWATGSANLPKNVNYGGTEISLEKFKEQSIAATRQLAKRQLTWLRGISDREVFDPLNETDLHRCEQVCLAHYQLI